MTIKTISVQNLPKICKFSESSFVKKEFLYQKRKLSVSKVLTSEIKIQRDFDGFKINTKANILYKPLRGILERDFKFGKVHEAAKRFLIAKSLLTESCQLKSEILHHLSSTRSDIQRERSLSTAPDTEHVRELENPLLILENELYESLHNANASGLSNMEDLVVAINNYHEEEKTHINFVKTCYLFISSAIIIIILGLWPKLEPKKKEKSYFRWALPKKT